MAMNLGGRLRLARETRGMTQTALSKRSGVSQAAISAIEKRDSEWTRFVMELASALDISDRWLASGDGEMYAAPTSAEHDQPAASDNAFIDAQIIEDVLEAIEEQRAAAGDPPLSARELARLIASAYADVVLSLRDEQRQRARSFVSRAVNYSGHSTGGDTDNAAQGSGKTGRS